MSDEPYQLEVESVKDDVAALQEESDYLQNEIDQMQAQVNGNEVTLGVLETRITQTKNAMEASIKRSAGYEGKCNLSSILTYGHKDVEIQAIVNELNKDVQVDIDIVSIAAETQVEEVDLVQETTLSSPMDDCINLAHSVVFPTRMGGPVNSGSFTPREAATLARSLSIYRPQPHGEEKLSIGSSISHKARFERACILWYSLNPQEVASHLDALKYMSDRLSLMGSLARDDSSWLYTLYSGLNQLYEQVYNVIPLKSNPMIPRRVRLTQPLNFNFDSFVDFIRKNETMAQAVGYAVRDVVISYDKVPDGLFRSRSNNKYECLISFVINCGVLLRLADVPEIQDWM